MAEYRLTPAAIRDLESIWAYTYQQWGAGQADRYIDMLTATFAELVQFPKSAPSCDHIRSGYRRRSVERHAIYFRVTSYGLAIIRVLHDRMDVLRHFQFRSTSPVALLRCLGNVTAQLVGNVFGGVAVYYRELRKISR